MRLWGVQSGNAIIVATIAKSAACKKIIERQEEVILRKKGRLQWSDIGGNLIRNIGGYTTIFLWMEELYDIFRKR
jgi:hypothetical protein